MPNTEERIKVTREVDGLTEATQKMSAMQLTGDKKISLQDGTVTLNLAVKAVKDVSSLAPTENKADEIVQEYIKALENERAQLVSKSTTTQSNLFFREAAKENQVDLQQVDQKVNEDSEINTPSSTI
ncbi:TPA: hypothetical protein ACTXXA_000129 [Legionella anisa]